MESKLILNEVLKERDYFPSLFVNKDKTIIILASERTGDKTFAGSVIHSNNESKKGVLGIYSTGWTYEQFERLTKGSKVTIELIQEEKK